VSLGESLGSEVFKKASVVCEICEGREFTLIATRIREGEGRIVKCDDCGLVLQDLDWDENKIKEYYDDEYQQTNSLLAGTKQTAKDHFEDRLRTIQPIFEQIKPLLKPESRVLEVGCGAGSLLSLINPHVRQCVGIELNSDFVGFINESLKMEAHSTDLNKIEFNQQFDLIISIATLDHTPNPLETLTTMKSLLAPEGKIYLEVPNLHEALNSFLPEDSQEKFREFFWHRAHFFYFSEESITSLFRKIGLNISIDCRHDYTIKNFLNWYFRGLPQPSYTEGTLKTEFFTGNDLFETKMNVLLKVLDQDFRKVMRESKRGESLCCTAWV